MYLQQQERAEGSTEACTIFNHMLRVHEDLSSTDPSFKEGLGWISTLFLQHNQGVLLYTRRHIKRCHGYTRTIVNMYLYILFTRASSYKSCLLSDLFASLYDGSGVSVHIDYNMILNLLVNPGTITQGSHRPTGRLHAGTYP